MCMYGCQYDIRVVCSRAHMSTFSFNIKSFKRKIELNFVGVKRKSHEIHLKLQNYLWSAASESAVRRHLTFSIIIYAIYERERETERERSIHFKSKVNYSAHISHANHTLLRSRSRALTKHIKSRNTLINGVLKCFNNLFPNQIKSEQKRKNTLPVSVNRYRIHIH